MYIQGLGTTYGETPSYTAPRKDIGKDEFLTLLIEQLKHQDPLNPLESTEFTAQLAQFNSLEQLFGVNDNLTGILEALYNQGEEDLLELIGKTVKANDNTILIEGGSTVSGSYTLEEAADVTISIYDSNGFEIRGLFPGRQDAGEYDIVWDGRDNSGEMVEDGIYTFEVTAKDEAGNDVAANTYISGEVTGVTYQYGIPYLMIGDLLVGTNNTIIEVKKTEPEDTTTVAEGTERYRPRIRRHEFITNNE
jgi:flagellar basal-body rod modification protein FlgD